MKFSVIGDQDAALELMHLIFNSSQHQLGPCCLSGALADSVATAGIPLQLEASPENAFLTQGVTAVILALDDCEQILNLTRSASQSERCVIVLVPPSASTAFSFELHLLLDESPCSVVPLIGRMSLPDLAVDQSVLAESAGDAWHSQVLQISIQTSIKHVSGPALRQVIVQLLDLPGALGLQYSQLTAIESTAPSGALISRSITLGASAMSEQMLPAATITLLADSPSLLSTSGSNESPEATNGLAQPSTMKIKKLDGSQLELTTSGSVNWLARIDWLCQNRDRCTEWMEAFSTSMELADAMDKSLRRRRTVDVYFDSGSERGVFKSQMTAIGCAVLSWTLFGMVAFLVIAQVADLPPMVLYIARGLWILPVVLFLTAQLLLPLTRDRGSHK